MSPKMAPRGRWDVVEKEHPRLRGLGSFLTPRFGVRLFVLATKARKATVRRFGPTTSTRARRLADASVDPTEARKATELAGDPILGAAVANGLDVESRSDAVV